MQIECLNPDQKPRATASSLGLHCFLLSLLWDANRKRTEGKYM